MDDFITARVLVTKAEKFIFISAVVAMCALFFHLLGSPDYSQQSRGVLEARKVDCSLGQIPLDCISDKNTGPRRQPTNKGNPE